MITHNTLDHPILSDTDYRDHAEFRYAIRRFLHFSEQQARAVNLTPQQHLLLLTVRGHPSYPGVSIGEIAERLQIRHHSASLLVERGVKRGLLVRGKDTGDRRRVVVSLTTEGLHLLSYITEANLIELRSIDDALNRMQQSLRHSFALSTGLSSLISSPVTNERLSFAEPEMALAVDDHR